jgi:phosphatidylglycerophosphatase C
LRSVAAFDFDGTLVSGDSLLPFLTRVRGRRAVASALAAHGPALAWALGGRGDRDVVKAAVLARVLRGLPAASVEALGVAYAGELSRRVRPEMLARIGWHRDQGHDVVMVSASLLVYLEPLGEMLGFDQVLATALEAGPDGLLTGRLVGGNVRGPEKAARLRAWLEGESCELWAYGDSSGDHDMFGLAASRAYLVGRRGIMRPWPDR